MANARLGQCPRCKAYALVDNADGIALAVDIAPVDAIGFGVAVASRRRLWWVETGQKRPSRILGTHLGTRNPSWGPGGVQTSIQKLHAEHSCGAPHRDVVIVPIRQADAIPVCDQWRATGWNPARRCPRQAGQTQIKSCAQCEAPPFDQGPDCYPGVQTGGSQEGRHDQIREGWGPDGPGADGLGGHSSAGGSNPVARQSRVRPDLGRPGEAAAPVDPWSGSGQPAGGGPRQPLDPGQSARQSSGGHPVGVQPQSGREDLAMGARREGAEVGAYGGDGEAQPGGVPHRDVRLGGGGAGGSGGIPDGPAHQGTGAGIQPASPAQSLRERGQVSRMHPRAIRCGTCNHLIDRSLPHFAIDHEMYAWGVHLECP